MLILSIDTSGAEQAVVLWQAGQGVLAQQTQTAQRGQGDALEGMIDAVLGAANKTLAHIDRLVVVTGVGSFTGLRIGIAAALGLARGLNKPLWGYQRFDLFASYGAEKSCALVFESLRDELYVQLPHYPPQMMTFDDIKTAMAQHNITHIAGDALVLAEAHPLHTLIQLPLAAVQAACACAAEAADSAPLFIEPYYLRAPDVTQPKAI